MFEEVYQDWLEKQIAEEKSPRRRELLQSGLGHGTVDFLRGIWFPAIGSFDHYIPNMRCETLTTVIAISI
ncbi:putative transcriptional regulator [Paenibacillus macerans]|uniref:Uncharacterized protein n=1 Tax=Paenibacillus macerans TaxID=44252 RepID=A0A090ZH51_PAEMA|nr:hypothetical protein DJ90_3109 [Paenibacillus macerans]GBK63089.1 hypothetical protein PbDSM24746_30930 [Paenibacillus macerans]GBK69402.1 hypothetical protein PbJCM17693_31100 [Paenibacillus macerans]GIP08272.1 hypothetical protein J1TS5_04420 [Paenibacillus macerans]SUA82518.1 putative transcriptional regulator [Paenibacillus macerans]